MSLRYMAPGVASDPGLSHMPVLILPVSSKMVQGIWLLFFIANQVSLHVPESNVAGFGPTHALLSFQSVRPACAKGRFPRQTARPNFFMQAGICRASRNKV